MTKDFILCESVSRYKLRDKWLHYIIGKDIVSDSNHIERKNDEDRK